MGYTLVAPFSNSDIRDWPAPHYAQLLALLTADPRWAGTVRVVGTRGQAVRACDIVRTLDPRRVVNECGHLTWDEVVAAILSADCVIGNNSGIAHLSARLGIPTICIFGGSHQRHEWRPIGDRLTVLSRAVGCSPCQLAIRPQCGHGLRCLVDIAPQDVAEAALDAMRSQSVAQVRKGTVAL